MSQKQEKGKVTGALSELMSFVVTLVVIAFCLALLVALFNGGLTGAQEFLGDAIARVWGWFGGLQSRLIGTAAGGVS